MSLESVMQKLENQIETLGATECSLEEIEASLDGISALGLKQRFKCSVVYLALWRCISSAPSVERRPSGAGSHSNNPPLP